MIKAFAFIITLFISIQASCQDWIKIYGQGQEAVARYVTEDYDKGFLFLGDLNYKYSWIFKTDVNGNIFRDKRIGKGTYTIGSSNIEKTTDGGL